MVVAKDTKTFPGSYMYNAAFYVSLCSVIYFLSAIGTEVPRYI